MKYLVHGEDFLAISAGTTNVREGMRQLTTNWICRGYASIGMSVDEALRARVGSAVGEAMSLADRCSDPSMAAYVNMVCCVRALPEGERLLETKEVNTVLSAYQQAANP